MSWVWSRHLPADLPKFVNPFLCDSLVRIPFSIYDLRRRNGLAHQERLAELIYETLKHKAIQYEFDKLEPKDPVQQVIRQPQEILASHKGNCLDLVLLFCGVCMAHELIPIIVVIRRKSGQGHVLAFVSLTQETRVERPEELEEQPLYKDMRAANPLFSDLGKLRDAIDSPAYLAIDCTGFARSTEMHAAKRNKEQYLDFADAVAVARAELWHPSVDSIYAIDCQIAHYRWKTELAPVGEDDYPNAEQLINRWRNWAEGRNYCSPLPAILDEGCAVESPVFNEWLQFVERDSWRDRLLAHVESLSREIDRLPIETLPDRTRKALASLYAANWDSSYPNIQRDLRNAVNGVNVGIRDEINRRQERQNLLDPLIKPLNLCASEAKELGQSLSSSFDRCLLVAASHGNGKSYLVDQALRFHAENFGKDGCRVLIVPIRFRSNLMDDALRELRNCLETNASLRAIDRSLSRIKRARIVFVIDDLQDRLRHDNSFAEQLDDLIKSLTEFRTVYLLIILNETGYDQVARLQHLWNGYAISFQKVAQHSGWVLLESINLEMKTGLQILKNADADDEFELDKCSDLLKRQICSPLVAGIVLTMLRSSKGSIVGLNYVDFVGFLWEYLMQGQDTAPYKVIDIQKAIDTIADDVSESGLFTLDSDRLKLDLHKDPIHAQGLLDCLWRMSLLRIEQPTWGEAVVVLQFELFWSHHLGRRLGKKIATNNKPQAAIIHASKTLEDEGIREAVVEQILLLLDSQKTRTKLHWNKLLESDFDTKSAIYFAGSKAEPKRQTELCGHLQQMVERKQGFSSHRELFAAMYFMGEVANMELDKCLMVLQGCPPVQRLLKQSSKPN